MDKEHPLAVNCPACSKLVIIGDDAKAGDSGACPFCLTEYRLEEVTVLVARAAADSQA